MEELTSSKAFDASSEQLLVISVRDSLRALRDEPRFEELRSTVDEKVLLEYGSDCDAVYALFDSLFEDTDETAFEKPIDDRERLLRSAFDWQDLFLYETSRQLRPFGLQMGYHVYGGQLVYGDRLVCVSPIVPNQS